MNDPRPASEFLRGILRDVGSRTRRSALADALEAAIGTEIASHCKVLGLRSGVLRIEVDSAPLYAELIGFRRESTRLAINEHLENQKVAEVVFRMGGTAHV